VIFVETSVFTRRVTQLLPDDDYRELQASLVENPEKGAIIPGSGGLRKIRWSGSGHGKRGGSRIIYYWATNKGQILMLFINAKNERDNLTSEQLKLLSRIVEKEYYEG
jgi:mRNA-degrading endonuclease RelE of RelBE toxin-antitoxin system